MNIKKAVTETVLILFSFSLQTTLFSFIPVLRASADVMLILTVCHALFRGERTGVMTGFICGLLYDIMFMDILGFYALLYAFIGFVCGALTDYFDRNDIRLPLAAIVISDIAFGLIRFFFLYVLMGNFDIAFYMRDSMLPEFVFTIIVSLVFYPLLLLIEKKIIEPKLIGKEKPEEFVDVV